MSAELGCIYGASHTECRDKAAEQLPGHIATKYAPQVVALSCGHFVAMTNICAGCHIFQVDPMRLLALCHPDDAISRSRQQLVVLEQIFRCWKRPLPDSDFLSGDSRRWLRWLTRWRLATCHQIRDLSWPLLVVRSPPSPSPKRDLRRASEVRGKSVQQAAASKRQRLRTASGAQPCLSRNRGRTQPSWCRTC